MYPRLTVALAAAFLASLPASAAETVTATQVVARIKAQVNCPWQEVTVDTFKAGEPNTPVTGIVTTFMATQAVLQKAVDEHCNFIISHEPIFYSHTDDRAGLESDAVLAAKLEFIKKHGLVIWRFHDHAHQNKPDLLNEGMIDALGLRASLTGTSPTLFVVPQTTVRELARTLKARLGAKFVTIIGNPDLTVTRVGFSAGAPPSSRQMRQLARDDVEVLLAGETRQWETVPYVQDAAAQGKAKAMILLGHANSEEAGMINVAHWLRGFVSEVPVKFIPAGDPVSAVE